MDDIDLLREYAMQNSEEAFATVVARHVNMVHSVAARQLGNSHQAEEVTQAVFVILARKARDLREGTILSGWLYHTARLTSANFLRGEIRRRQREQEAHMQSLLNETEADPWPQIAPMLDDAMAGLGEKDRDAIALRFFEGKNFRSVGADLGVSEDAAKMRVNRAVDKLRSFFSKRGVTLSAAIICGSISANSVQAAPAGLVSASIAAAQGISLSVSNITLIKGTLKLMAWTKMKIAVVTGAAVLLTAGTTAVVLSTNAARNGPSSKSILEKAGATYAALSTYSSTGKIVSEFEGLIGDNKFLPQVGSQTETFNIKMARPNLYRIEWEQKTAYFTNNGAVWSSGEGDFSFMNRKTTKMRDRKTSLGTAAGVSQGATANVPSAFFNTGTENSAKNSLESFADAINLAREKDEIIAGVDCYVLSRTKDIAKDAGFAAAPGSQLALWIGKADHLIHQRRISTKDFKINLPGNTGSLAAKKMTVTETLDNIVINEPIAKEDFVYEVPGK